MADRGGASDNRLDDSFDEVRAAQALARQAAEARREGASSPGQAVESPPRAQEASVVKLSAADAAAAALRQITELTRKEVTGVTSVEPIDDGWLVGIEVIEDRRIPSSADILAIYQARVVDDGLLVAYHRRKRYLRGRGDDGNGDPAR